jgi:hypothetical protein
MEDLRLVRISDEQSQIVPDPLGGMTYDILIQKYDILGLLATSWRWLRI